MAYIEVPFTSGEKKLRPDGVVQVKRGSALWTVLIEVKTGANEPKAAQVESYLDGSKTGTSSESSAAVPGVPDNSPRPFTYCRSARHNQGWKGFNEN
jgi:hypothetical protein